MSQTLPDRPLVIAHRAGNSLERLTEAFSARMDYAETDVWLYRGRLEVRHAKTAGPLPFLWERWSLKPAWSRRLLVSEVLVAAKDHGRLLLDLKGDAEGLAAALANAVEAERAHDYVAFTGLWPHLDRLAVLLPDVPRFYTVGRPERLDDLRQRLPKRDIVAVTINHRLLTEAVVSELSGLGVERLVAWTVNDPARARAIIEWGGGGITSDDLDLLRSIRAGESDAP